MHIKTKDFLVQEEVKIDLKQWPTAVKSLCKSKEEYKHALAERVEATRMQESLLYANSRHALLVIFQAMDAAGKDSAIKHLMSGINPQGCQVHSFKQPSAEELRHDFLWRTTSCVPERGQIGIFNRSYYEELLVVKVHPELLQHQGIESEAVKAKGFWQQRYRSIVEFERHLHANGTRILKFFLHVSKEEQRQRFLQRIDDPAKNWKFSLADIEERKFWKDYRQAYEQCLAATSTKDAPWFIVPADRKEDAWLIMSEIILKTLQELKMSYPQVDEARLEELARIRKLLAE